MPGGEYPGDGCEDEDRHNNDYRVIWKKLRFKTNFSSFTTYSFPVRSLSVLEEKIA